MGNALAHGTDGLTTADLSAVESFSIGTYGDGTQIDSANTNRKSQRQSSRNYYNGSPRSRANYGEYNQRGDYTESITGTSTSSVRYRAGYPPPNHDSDRGYEDRDDYYYESDIAAYRNDPKAYISDRLHEYETNRRAYRHHEARHHPPKAIGSGHGARTGQSRYYEGYSKITNRKPSAEETNIAVEPSEGGIYPAETDMAYANSQDESQLDPEHPQPPTYFSEQNNKKKKQQELASTASDVLGSLARLEKERREIERKGYEGDGDESQGTMETADTFSTLTKTIDTMHLCAKQQGISKKQLEQRIKNGQVPPGSKPGSNKIEELLRQQELQEEKLQRQLEQLRLQKQRLQQLQQEENHTEEIIRWNLQELRLAKARENCMPQSPNASKVTTRGVSGVGNDPEIIHLEDEAVSDVVVLDNYESIGDKCMDDQSKDGGDCDQVEDEEQQKQEKEDGQKDGKGEGGGESKVFEKNHEVVSSHCSVDPEAAYNPSGAEAHSPALKQQSQSILGTEKMEEKQGGHDKEAEQYQRESHDEEEEEVDQAGGNSNVLSFDDTLQEMLSSMDDSIDLEFVAKYDEAFSMFLAKFDAEFDQDSELIQNLKIAKLQKILEASYQAEADLETQLESSADMNTKLEADFQQKLRQASKNKAARLIQLQSDVSRLKKKNKSLEGKLTWDLLTMAIKRACRLKKLETSSDNQSRTDTTREDLLRLLSDHTSMDDVKNAMKIEPREDFGPKQQRYLQKLQVDNAFLHAEARVLEGKVSHQKELAKKQALIDETLLKLDSKKLEKLKTSYKKKLGASF